MDKLEDCPALEGKEIGKNSLNLSAARRPFTKGGGKFTEL